MERHIALTPQAPKQTFLHFLSREHSSSAPQSSFFKHSYEMHSLNGSPEYPLGQLHTALCRVAKQFAFFPQDFSWQALVHSLEEHCMSSPQSLSLLQPGTQTPC